MWYFGEEELQNTPSLRDGIDSKTEIKYRTESVKFIRDVGGKMELGYNTIATAVVYFHRFYIRNSFKEYPRYVSIIPKHLFTYCHHISNYFTTNIKYLYIFLGDSNELSFSRWKDRRNPEAKQRPC